MLLVSAIKSATLQARKARDATAALLFTTLLSDVQMVGKNDGDRETTEAEAVAILKKFIANTTETINVAGTSSKLENELALLNALLPKQMSEEDLMRAIDEIALDCGPPGTPMKDMGRIMKELKEKHGGRYDGAVASKLVKNLLANAKA
jgi:uncharacterized protein YqeY